MSTHNSFTSKLLHAFLLWNNNPYTLKTDIYFQTGYSHHPDYKNSLIFSQYKSTRYETQLSDISQRIIFLFILNKNFN